MPVIGNYFSVPDLLLGGLRAVEFRFFFIFFLFFSGLFSGGWGDILC